jgi:hypothetical protein
MKFAEEVGPRSVQGMKIRRWRDLSLWVQVTSILSLPVTVLGIVLPIVLTRQARSGNAPHHSATITPEASFSPSGPTPPSAVAATGWQGGGDSDSTYHCSRYSPPLGGLHGTVKFQECVIVVPTTDGAYYQGLLAAGYTSASGGADTYTGSQEASAGNTIGIRADCGAVTFVVSGDRRWCFTRKVHISGHEMPLSASGVLVNQTAVSQTLSSPNCVVVASGCRD